MNRGDGTVRHRRRLGCALDEGREAKPRKRGAYSSRRLLVGVCYVMVTSVLTKNMKLSLLRFFHDGN